MPARLHLHANLAAPLHLHQLPAGFAAITVNNGSELTDGDALAAGSEFTVDSATAMATFTVTNTGTADLILDTPTADSQTGCSVGITGTLSAGGTLAPEATGTVIFTVTPSATSWSFTASLGHNAVDSPFTQAVSGTATEALWGAELDEVTLAMFGGGAPQVDPFGEYTGVVVAGKRWTVDATFASARNGLNGEMIMWKRPIQDVFTGAPDPGWGCVIMAEINIRTATTSTSGMASAAIGSDFADDYKGHGIGIRDDKRTYQQKATTVSLGPTGGTGTQMRGYVSSYSDGTNGRLCATHTHLHAGTTTEAKSDGLRVNDNPSTILIASNDLNVALAFGLGSGSGATTIDADIRLGGYEQPLPPHISTDYWTRLPCPGGAPSRDTNSIISTAPTAGDDWVLGVDTNVAAGFTVNGQAQWNGLTPPGDLACDGEVPLHIAVLPTDDWDASDEDVGAWAGFQKDSATNHLLMVGFHQIETNEGRATVLSTSYSAAGQGTTCTGAIGSLSLNLADSGNSYMGTGEAHGLTDTGLLIETAAASDALMAQSVTTPGLSVAVSHQNANGVGNTTHGFEVWLWEPAVCAINQANG